MVHADNQQYALTFLLPEEHPAWFQTVYADLNTASYRIQTVTHADFQGGVTSPKADAIIAPHSSESLKLFTTLYQQHGDHLQRPLYVLITEPQVASVLEAYDSLADMVVPALPGYISPQLRTYLRLRGEALALSQRNLKLQEKNKRLKKDLQLQQRSADEVNLLKNAIVRNVSHELKTPLLHLKSAVHMLAEDTKNNTLVEYATNATARLEGLVHNITQLASSLDINLTPIILREIIDQAIRNLRRSWESRNEVGRIKLEVADSLPIVMGDRQGLSTVLQLLIGNALKFSDNEVIVRAEQVNNTVKVSVCDTGIGIAEEELEKIFELFYQVDSSSTRPYGGTGVGLAIVRLILERHGVKITVESKEGTGSTFAFVLAVANIDGQV